MDFFLLVLSIFIFIKTLSYAIYEIKEQKNTSGGVVTITFASIAFLLSVYVLIIKDYL